MSQPPNTRSSSADSGTTSLIFGERPSVRLPRRTVPICVSEPIGLAKPFRMASTPAIVVVLTAPRPTRSMPIFREREQYRRDWTRAKTIYQTLWSSQLTVHSGQCSRRDSALRATRGRDSFDRALVDGGSAAGDAAFDRVATGCQLSTVNCELLTVNYARNDGHTPPRRPVSAGSRHDRRADGRSHRADRMCATADGWPPSPARSVCPGARSPSCPTRCRPRAPAKAAAQEGVLLELEIAPPTRLPGADAAFDLVDRRRYRRTARGDGRATIACWRSARPSASCGRAAV